MLHLLHSAGSQPTCSSTSAAALPHPAYIISVLPEAWTIVTTARIRRIIPQSSVITIFKARWAILSEIDKLQQIFTGVACQNLLKSVDVSQSYSKHTFIVTHCIVYNCYTYGRTERRRRLSIMAGSQCSFFVITSIVYAVTLLVGGFVLILRVVQNFSCANTAPTLHC